MQLHIRGAVAIALAGIAAMRSPAILAAPAGDANAAGNADTPKLEEIVVTARKREESLTDVPVTVDVVNSQEMFSARLNGMGDVSDTIPNVNFATDSASRARISIRGVGSDYTGIQGPGVGFYIDGVYQNSTAALNAPFFDLQRVEVLKGPQGTLYGRNALGGVINYITPKPNSEFSSSLQAEAASFDTYNVAAAVGGPIVADRLYGRISVEHSQSDGPWHYNPSGLDVATNHFNSVRARLVFDATDRLNFDLTGSYYKLVGPGLPLTTVTDLQHLGENFMLNPPNVATNDDYSANLATTYSFDTFQILSRTSYDRLRDLTNIDSDFSPINLIRIDSVVPRRVYSEELRFQSTTGNTFQWLVGGQYSHEKNASNSAETGLLFDTLVGAPGVEYNIDAQITADIWSAFADLTYNITPRLELGGGVRYDNIDQKDNTANTIIVGPIVSPAGTFSQPLEESQVQPKATARYKFTDELAVFASAAKGFRQGGFNPTSVGTPYATYAGDVLWNYEIGVKWRDAGGRATANLSTFYIDWQKVTGAALIPTVTGTPASGVALFGKARSYGVEADGQLKLNRFFSLSGSAGWLDCKYTQVDANATPGIVKGAQCADSSVWNFRTALAFEHSLGQSDKHLFANVSGDGRGGTRVGLDVLDRSYRQIQGNYYLLGSSVGVKDAHWTLLAYGDNLLDKRYATTIYTKEALAIYGAQSDTAILGQPRTFGVRLRYDF